ncbi:DUF397 domain-containing protein [Actinomadura livida]|uniref:DUF397 domain-containing protein n=1 Tax=Actinomadura livida TaxID=79909 RepID=A0ABN1FMW0_9ACTN|nr:MULTISPECIES: DUF397 domain-containing protein [Actinomadura]GGU31630.1 hypothetical protein GCM10010208_65430 [Actinomadura livida]
MTLRHVSPGAQWRKSDRSGSGNCVEVADLRAGVGVRDGKVPDTGHLVVTREAWTAFVAEVQAGRYDL